MVLTRTVATKASAAIGAALAARGLGDTAMMTGDDADGRAAASAASLFLDTIMDHCPCWDSDEQRGEDGSSLFSANHHDHHYDLFRLLQEDEDAPPAVWETVVVSLVLVVMLLFLMLDKVGPDWVMITALAIFMVTQIITVKEGLAGFANEGILTVMALFVVAEGVSRTGALDYYMGLVLGSPKTVAGAQIRLMLPVAILSAFLNNTPIVVVMIPLTLRWAKKNGIPKEQLLMPLSYATILGGTCTLVGTSTNLVVSGLLETEYPDEESGNIGLFDLAVFGVPNMLIGVAYMLVCAPFLLPKGVFGKQSGDGSSSDADALLMGARVKAWSPAAGRTYKRSGLGNSGGIFLVNVRRAGTGNVHTAVSKDFVISVGDELYFTGFVEVFGDFCKKHGLEIITKDKDNDSHSPTTTIPEQHEGLASATYGNSPDERVRLIRHLSDQIDGREPVDTTTLRSEAASPTETVIVSWDETEQAVLVGVDCPDRPGLLTDISDALSRQGLNIRHSEAKVFGDRSLSVWGCEPDIEPGQPKSSSSDPDLDEIWAAVQSMILSSDHAATFSKKKTAGTQVVRAVVTQVSTLLGQKPSDVNFRTKYLASVVAYQKKGKNSSLDVELGADDLLVLETMEGSPLLLKPPEGFYDKIQTNVRASAAVPDTEGDDVKAVNTWRDLKVLFLDATTPNHGHPPGVPEGEFLTAFIVTKNSPLINKSLNHFGYGKLPGVVLIGVERKASSKTLSSSAGIASTTISADDPLQEGDIFWYSGSAESIAVLQKLHGLVFYHDGAEQVAKEEAGGAVALGLTERRLVQAVVARGSPLVGVTVKDVHFRSVYGGVVIAIQRGSERIHELPANVKLQTGDVLLVEAGSSFVELYGSNYRTFALISEVENSSPPRPRLFLLCAALIITSLTVAGLEIRSLLITALITGIIMVSLGIVTQQEARDCLQWDLYITIASAFGIGTAMLESGVAEGIATVLVDIGEAMGIGDAGVYGAVYFAGNLLSAILTNNAAATLMFPIAMNAVDQTGADRLKMCYILMLSSSDYITSFGYQTNLMVYGPGEYRNVDYFKFGAPMQLLLWLSTTAMVSTLSVDDPKWIISWIICALVLAVIAAFRLTGGCFLLKHKKDTNDDQHPSKQ